MAISPFNPSDRDALAEAVHQAASTPGYWLTFSPEDCSSDRASFLLHAGVKVDLTGPYAPAITITNLRSSRRYCLRSTPTSPVDLWDYLGQLEVDGHRLSVGYGDVSGMSLLGVKLEQEFCIVFAPTPEVLDGISFGLQWCAEHLKQVDLVHKLQRLLPQLNQDLHDGYLANNKERFYGGI